MSNILTQYQNDVSKVFSIGVDVLNVARSLKSISMDIKLLAYNGIVQAARIGSDQGKSLITLSGFLSDLPSQIAPELEDLEKLCGDLASQITITSIAVRKFMLYSMGLQLTFSKIYNEYSSNSQNDRETTFEIDIFSAKELSRIKNNFILSKAGDIQRNNIIFLANKNLALIADLNEMLRQTQKYISLAQKKIDRIRRNGFIANYMGSNISIEAAYLVGNQKSFAGLVNNIKDMVEVLNHRLDSILDKINGGDKLISKLIRTELIK
jgi:hypothetical protein